MYIGKVLSFLDACFDLISGSSLSMKIQIMGGKITENLGFKSKKKSVKIIPKSSAYLVGLTIPKTSIKNENPLVFYFHVQLPENM